MSDSTDSAARIGAALARLRLGQRGAGPFGRGTFGFGSAGPGAHGREDDAERTHGGPGVGWPATGDGHDRTAGPAGAHGDRRHGWPGPPHSVGPHSGGRGEWPHDARRHGALGRSMARLRLLEVLAAAGEPMSVGQIAEKLGVDQPRASRLVQAVVEAGLARRDADPRDARRTLIGLTEAGRQAAARTHGARAEAVEQALEGFTDIERAQLADLLTRLADAWPASHPPAPPAE